MHIIFFFVAAVLLLRNPFSNKKYKAYLINKTVLVYRSNPEIVLHDYHNYVLRLLRHGLVKVKKSGVIYLECPGLRFLKFLFPAATIYLQIEHTLFAPDSRHSKSAIEGGLFMTGSQKKYLVRVAEYDKLVRANIIFDYSRINLLNIKSLPSLQFFSNKLFCISPALYPIYTNTQNRNGVITLFGNPAVSRRKQFLDSLRDNNIDYENIRGVYFGVDEIYRRVKMVINIRQTAEFHTLEELRVLPALRSGAIVICEIAPYVKKTAYSKFIIWGTLQELPRIISEVEENYEETHKRIFGDGTENSIFIKRMKRIEKCNLLSMQRAINKLNESQLSRFSHDFLRD